MAWDIVPRISFKQTDVSRVHTATKIRARMQAVHSSEALVFFNETTRRNTPEGCHLHTLHPENLKSHFILQSF
jgi:hypothetical protein